MLPPVVADDCTMSVIAIAWFSDSHWLRASSPEMGELNPSIFAFISLSAAPTPCPAAAILTCCRRGGVILPLQHPVRRGEVGAHEPPRLEEGLPLARREL